MKKLFTMLAMLMLVLQYSMAGEATFNLGENPATSTPADFFTHSTDKWNINTKYKDATYNGITFSRGLKMESTTAIYFTTTKESTVTIVQATNTQGDKTIKFDGEELVIANASVGTNYRVYTISNVAAGEHSITRGSGETGLFYVKVEWEDEVVVTNKTIFLVPGPWNVEGVNQRFAAYVWAGENDEKVESWMSFNEVEGVFSTTIPDTYTGLILTRMNGNTTENNWDNKWNQTVDIDFTTIADQTIFTITEIADPYSAYTTSNPLQEAKDKLNKLIAMAETLDATILATQIAAAKTAAEGTNIEAMQTAANNLFAAAVPVANEVLAKAEEFATKYGYTDVTTAINNVKAAIPTDASGDLDNLQAALNALSAVALPAAQDAVGKIESYAEALDDEALDAAVATAKTALGTGNFKAILAALKDAETPFITAAQAYVTKVQGENIEDADVQAALSALAGALAAEQPNIVTVGNAVKALVDAYNAYQLELNPVYTVAGTANLTGFDWNTTKNKMTLNTETGLYVWTSNFVAVNGNEEVKFKIVRNSNWDTSWPSSDWLITPESLEEGDGIYTITITFNAETKDIFVTGVKRVMPVFAKNNIYYWESPDGYVDENGGTAVHNNNNDVDRVNYLTAGYYTISLNGDANYSTDYITITLDDGYTLKAGDEIAITAFRYKDATGKKSGAKLKFDDGSTMTTGSGTEFVNLHSAVEGNAEYGTEPNTVIITVPESADGSKTITMTRSNTGTNLFITKIDITRPETDFAYCVVEPDGNVYVNSQVMTESEGVFTATLENMAGKYFAIAPKEALDAIGKVTDWSKVIRPTSEYDFLVEYFTNYEDVTQSVAEGGKVWHVADNNSSKLTLTYTPAVNKFTITTDAVMNVTISEAGYATYSNAQPYKVSGAEVYTVSAATTKATFNKLAEGAELPGGTGVILKGSGAVTITPSAGTAQIGTNLLVGSGDHSYTITDNDADAYIFQNGDNGVGFYKVDLATLSDDEKVLPAHKAFLKVSGGQAPFFGFADGETTGIESLTPALSQGEGVCYTLDGRRVEKPTKGLYIVNGKKVLVP